MYIIYIFANLDFFGLTAASKVCTSHTVDSSLKGTKRAPTKVGGHTLRSASQTTGKRFNFSELASRSVWLPSGSNTVKKVTFSPNLGAAKKKDSGGKVFSNVVYTLMLFLFSLYRTILDSCQAEEYLCCVQQRQNNFQG